MEVTVAEVAQALGLPGIPPEVAHRTHNKLLTKEAFVRGGVETPRTFAVESLEETKARAGELGLPVVIKPLNNCASRGVTLIEHESDLASAFELARRFGSNGKILVEAFLAGTTHTVEMIAWNGSYHTASHH